MAAGVVWRLTAIFALGALQGALGWYMVASGLVDNPRVSPFRLTAHLGLALLIIGAILWTAWGLWSAPVARRPVPALARLTVAVVFAMALTGGLVAGTRAGFAYNTFPLMGGAIVPPDLMRIGPWYLNWMSEPSAQARRRIGVLAIAFLAVFIGVGRWLNAVFWRDIH